MTCIIAALAAAVLVQLATLALMALAPHLAGATGGLASLSAWGLVAALILYFPAHAAGLVPWRSLVWGWAFSKPQPLPGSALL